jgi:hypothetical protein
MCTDTAGAEDMFMKMLIFMFAVIIGILYYTKPPWEQHQYKILANAWGEETELTDADLALPKWEDLEFKDWKVVTITQNKDMMTMVSIGMGKSVLVIDEDWGRKVFGRKRPKPQFY